MCIINRQNLQVLLVILYVIGYYTKRDLIRTCQIRPRPKKQECRNCKNEKPEQNLRDTIINLETVNPIEFFGVNNGKLDILKKKFPLLKILSRGTQLKLSGAPEQIETAREKISLIVTYLERNGHMSQNYFEQILGGDDAEVIDHFQEKNPNEVLVFGPNGKSVRARTANQKKLVQAGDRNDILFAIGPAGTGKTYTA